MKKISKIESVREDLRRIASDEDRRNLCAPTMLASWSFTSFVVIGKTRIQAFDYEVLKPILRRIPNKSGEEFFWKKVDACYRAEVAQREKPDCKVIDLKQFQKLQRLRA